jgi:hypothetical protein
MEGPLMRKTLLILIPAALLAGAARGDMEGMAGAAGKLLPAVQKGQSGKLPPPDADRPVARNPGPQQNPGGKSPGPQQNPGPPTAPGAEVQTKPGPPQNPGGMPPGPPDAPGAEVQLRPGPPNAPGDNQLLPAVQTGMAGMTDMAGNALPAVQAPGAALGSISPGPPQIGGSNLPAVQAPGAAAGVGPGPINAPGGLGGIGGAGMIRH